ncbi:SMC-Scp complex subunit ScpB [Microbulbifer elongatus]|uniref:SMC-Scp complex subunit ScpB n=1 Tax=Microbulbifer elongatus TaxID=86173 RepID=UPI001CFD0EE0|nr:SMC-Scp complex subunit ScpB [Microbulbifer elongatus]
MTIAPELLRRIVEGALLAAAQPLSEDRLLSLIEEGERPEKAVLREALEQIAENCAERGFELKQVASGWRFQVPEDLAPWVNKLWEEKPQKYSRATLETLAIIAYRQPITRGDIEEIRGVAVSSHIVKSLSERGWIKVVGQRDVPGKPSLYATTREFLDYFNLKSLDDLPTLAEIRDIESLNAALDLGDGAAAGDGTVNVAEAAETGAEASVAEDAADEENATEVTANAVSEEPETSSEDAVLDESTDAEEENARQAVAEDYAEEAQSPEIEVDLDDQEQGVSVDDETPLEESAEVAFATNETDEAPEAEESTEQEAVNEDENKSPENLNS